MSLYATNKLLGVSGSTIHEFPTMASFPAAPADGYLALDLSTDILYVYDSNVPGYVAIAGPGSVLSIGTIDSVPPSSDGAVINLNALVMQSASATEPGLVNNAAQTLSGSKTFSSVILAPSGIDVATTGGTDTLAIGTNGADVINIGNSGATINIQGTTLYENVTQLQVSDPLITINVGGGPGSGADSGIEIEENAVVTGYAQTSSDRNSWSLKAPNTAGVVTLTPGASGITLDQSSHNPVTLGTANGLSLSTQQLSLGLSSTSTTGALSSTDWNTFNNKQPAGSYVTSVAVATANGLAGSSSGGTTPSLTLSTTVTGILQGNGTAISAASTTGSGSVVLDTSPILTTPNLGTPSALVGTNITGTASGLTAGTVTTNANLTGPVTSVGNATTIGSNVVTLGNLSTLPAHSYIGNNTGSSATPIGVTSTQLTADLNTFTSSLQGLVPASGGGTTNFLRADGTFAAPTGTGTVTTVSVVSANGLAGTVANPTTTPALTLSTTITGILQGDGTAISAASTSGSGSIALTTNAVLTTPNLGTPSAVNLTNASGLTGSAFGTQTAGTYLGGPYSGSAANPTFKAFQVPTVQTFASGSGTYTTPAGVLYIIAELAGGGGGGAGGGTGTSGGSGSDGTSTTFGTLTAALGSHADSGSNNGGAGGAPTVGAGWTAISAASGGGGGGSTGVSSGGAGITGGVNALGGNARGPAQGVASSAAASNSGAGGCGGSANPGNVGAGGGAGAWLKAIIAPTAGQTFAYSVGTGGNGGSAGTTGNAGGAGGSGIIRVTEYYQ